MAGSRGAIRGLRIWPQLLLLGAVLCCSSWAGAKAEQRNLLAGARWSVGLVEQGKPGQWSDALIFKEEGEVEVALRAIFTEDVPLSGQSLSLEMSLPVSNVILNGVKVSMPMEGVQYKKVPEIAVSALKPGENILLLSLKIWVSEVKDEKSGPVVMRPAGLVILSAGGQGRPAILRADEAPQWLDFRLALSEPSGLGFQTGPILGYAGRDFFTVSCRTNMRAVVVLKVGQRNYRSQPGLVHAFKAAGLEAGREYHYRLAASLPGEQAIRATTGVQMVRTMPAGDRLVFAVLGDARSHPQRWAQVAAAVLQANPAFSIFNGDMVTNGRRDHEWDEEFFGPGREYFARIPFYAVIGNHEQNSPLFLKIFQTPSGQLDWAQQIGAVLIIGIDLSESGWQAGGQRVEWLEGVLSGSRAKFIFLANHYPAWSSGKYGRVDSEGRARNKYFRMGREVIMPLLKKYEATAMIGSHSHFYERSEPEDGVTMINTSGAGAPLRKKVKGWRKQNPYSKAFASKLHYCLFKIDADRCTMKAVTPKGKVLDKRTWKARQSSLAGRR